MTDAPWVMVHIGLPKTGTTYLQRLLAANRAALRERGLLYPGTKVDHFLAVQDVLRRPFKESDERTSGAWGAVLTEVEQWSGPCLVSHEILASARPDGVADVIGSFATRPVQVIVTARDLARQLPAVWQEDVKNGSTEAFDEYLDRVRRVGADPQRSRRRFWKFQDLPAIAARWADFVGSPRVRVVTVPPPGSTDTLWRRFSRAVGIEPEWATEHPPRSNESLGAAEAEVVRRINAWADDALTWPQYRRLVKKGLAERTLAGRQHSPRLAITPEIMPWVEEEAERTIDALSALGVSVVGSLDDLRPRPSVPPEKWAVDEAAVAAAAIDALTTYLTPARGESDQ
jgi:hypothetical protein